VRKRSDDVRRRREWRRFDCSGDENGIQGQGRSPAQAGVRRWSSHTLNGFNHIGISAKSYCRCSRGAPPDRRTSCSRRSLGQPDRHQPDLPPLISICFETTFHED
jgi:hypothetical protein